MARQVAALLAVLVLTASPVNGADPSSFLSVRTSTFELRYAPQDEDQVGDALRMLEHSYRRIVDEFGFYTLQTFTVILQTDSDLPQRHSKLNAFYRPATKSIHIRYNRLQSRFADRRRLQQTFTHELSQAFVDSLAGSANCPRWFKEGAATYVESTEDRAHRRTEGRRQARAGVFAALNAAPYESGPIAIDYLMSHIGPLSVRQIVETMQHTGQPFPQALMTVTGLDLDGFEQSVTEWLLGRR